MVEQDIFETILSFLPVPTICMLESSCSLLREMVVLTRVYRKRFQKISTKTSHQEEPLSQLESSTHFKRLLAEYYHR